MPPPTRFEPQSSPRRWCSSSADFVGCSGCGVLAGLFASAVCSHDLDRDFSDVASQLEQRGDVRFVVNAPTDCEELR